MFKLRLISVFFLFLYATTHVYGDFDYMQLVLQWPPSYCLDKKCNTIPRNFTIHGLWPDNENNVLNNCKPKSYKDIRDLPIQNKIYDRWPDLKRAKWLCMKDQEFWRHEFNKHGSCSMNRYDQKAYFDLAINLKDKFDLLTTLRKQRIYPGFAYTVKEIGDAIKTVTTVYPNMKCTGNSAGQMVLLEIGICFEPDATKVIPCHRPLICHKDETEKIDFPQ